MLTLMFFLDVSFDVSIVFDVDIVSMLTLVATVINPSYINGNSLLTFVLTSMLTLM